jgi:hypothetical protein
VSERMSADALRQVWLGLYGGGGLRLWYVAWGACLLRPPGPVAFVVSRPC